MVVIVTLQFHGEQVSLLCHDRKDLLLYRRRSQLDKHIKMIVFKSNLQQNQAKQRNCESYLDPAEHAGIKDVHASVDLVGDKDLRFLNKAMNSPTVCVKHHHAVLRGLLHSRHLHTQSGKKINLLKGTEKISDCLLCLTFMETRIIYKHISK